MSSHTYDLGLLRNLIYLLTSCSSLFYALRVLRTHGIPDQSLHDVFRATVVAKIMYCAPAWSGMCSAADRTRLSSLLRRAKRLNYCTDDLPPIAELFSKNDFFHTINTINTNSNHVLQPYLPDNNKLPYQLRTRQHNKSLIIIVNTWNGLPRTVVSASSVNNFKNRLDDCAEWGV